MNASACSTRYAGESMLGTRPDRDMTSFYSRKTTCTPSGTGRNIAYGDRIFVRLTSGMRTLLELTVTNVASLTDLLAELRRHTRGRRGLVKMFIRNFSRGWSTERPLMLYAPAASPSPFSTTSSSSFSSSPSFTRKQPERMLMPWETH